MPKQKPGSSKQNYKTPREFINAVERRFGKLTFDLAADSRNTVVKGRYFSTKHDSLKQNWSHRALGSNLWLNPPYGDIAPWAERCALFRSTKQIFFLVPASVGSNWFAEHVHEKALVLLLSPRLSFDGQNPYPKDVLLACYGLAPGYETWRWK